MAGLLHTMSHQVEIDTLRTENRRLDDDLRDWERRLRRIEEDMRYHPGDFRLKHDANDARYRCDELRSRMRRNDDRIRELQRLIDMEMHHHHAPPPPPPPRHGHHAPPPPPHHGSGHGGNGGYGGPGHRH